MFASLAGRTVIVTGASKGIGRGIADRFAQIGCNVVLVARSPGEAARAAKEIAASGGKAIGVEADVATQAGVDAMVDAATRQFGGIDVLCANAGVYSATMIADMSVAQFDDLMGINMRGTFLSVKACLPALGVSGRGRIVLTSSITGPVTGMLGFSHYGASKAAQLGFMRSAAMELAAAGITINAVLPGNIITEGLIGLGEDYMKTMAASIPLKRLGVVADIANAALYFATEEAGFVTGQTLVVDGGQILPESLTV